MKIYRMFYIPNINEDTQNKIVDYWEKRNAQFTRITEREYEAKRGRLLNNLFALRMDKLNQVVTWSLQSKHDEYKDEFIAITSTFKKVGVSEPDNILNVVR